ncbi:MAG: GGDEF domain-containing protein, partial [Thiomonas sp.]
MPYDAAVTTPNETIAAERGNMLLATVPVSAVTNAGVAAVAVALLNGGPQTRGLWIWGAWMLGLQLSRLLLWLARQRTPTSALDIALQTRRLRLLRGTAWATGASWGAIPVVLFPPDPLTQSFVAFILAGV